jgi:hypothetical protein
MAGLGRRFVARPASERFDERACPEPTTGCWLWTGYLNADGYGLFYFGSQQMKAPRAAWLLFRGEIPDGLSVLHHCDTPACVNPAHLFVGTHQDNMTDRGRKGRAACGDRSGPRLHPEARAIGTRNANAKLDPAAVTELRRLAAEGSNHCAIARRLGVSPRTVRAVLDGRTWRHVPLREEGVSCAS